MRVSKKLASDDLIAGAKILCSVVEAVIRGQRIYVAQEIKMAVPPQEDVVEGEVIDAEFSEVDEKPKTDPVLDEARAHGLSGLFRRPAAEDSGCSPGGNGADRDRRTRDYRREEGKEAL